LAFQAFKTLLNAEMNIVQKACFSHNNFDLQDSRHPPVL
jgi:hypothetical protein